MAPELHLILRNAQFLFLTCMNKILVTQVHKSCHVGSSVFAIFLLRDSLWNSLPCGNRINIWWITTPPASSFKATKGPPKNEILSVIQTGAILRCYFLPSSWCQRSPSEKVETFLHIFSDIGEQLLSAESEMGIGILNIIEIFFQHHWNICWTSLKYEFVCSRIDLISIWIIHQPNRIWFWHSSSLQEDPLLVTAKRKYDSNYSNKNLGF